MAIAVNSRRFSGEGVIDGYRPVRIDSQQFAQLPREVLRLFTVRKSLAHAHY